MAGPISLETYNEIHRLSDEDPQLSNAEIGRRLGIGKDAVRKWRHRSRHPHATVASKSAVASVGAEILSHEDEHQLKKENRRLRRHVNELMDDRARDSRFLELADKITEANISVPKWAEKGSKGRENATAVAMMSDWHLDETVYPEQVDGCNAFNRKIAEVRVRQFFDNIDTLCHKHLQGVTYDGLYLLMGGDIFSGNIHEELEISNESTIMDSMIHWTPIVISGLRYLAEKFGHIHIPVVVGNHGRRCFADGTEILTRRGWIDMAEVTRSDYVGTVNPDTHAMEWQQPTDVWSYDYSGPMVVIETSRIRLRVTPEHDLYIRQREETVNGKLYKWPYSKRQAGERDWGSNWKMLTAAEGWQGTAGKLTIPGTARLPEMTIEPSADWARFFGWYVSEGNTESEGRITLSQSKEAHPDHYRAIQDLCLRLGFSPGCADKTIRISCKPLALWISCEFGSVSREKRLPRWLLDWPAELLAAFLETAMDGDGYRESATAWRYTSTSDDLLDGMQEVAIKLGWGTALKERYTCAYAGTDYVGSAKKLHLRRDSEVGAPNDKSYTEPYTGKVRCVTVPNGLVITRDEGFPVVSGNSRKPIAKNRAQDNFDYLFAHMLAMQVQDDPRITWQIAKAADCRFALYDTTFLLTHGDQFRGGSGISGPVTPWALGDHRKRKRMQGMGLDYDWLIFGHWHTLTLGMHGMIVNGCFTPDTRVWSHKGQMPISSIQTGDFVLSRDGSYQRVTHVFRKQSDAGLVKLKVRGLPEVTSVTPNHLIWAIKAESPMSRLSPRYRPLTAGADKPQWIPADYLSDGDWIHVPAIGPAETVRPCSAELAWVYGLYLAEGHTLLDGGATKRHNRIEFSMHIDEYDILQRAKSILDTHLGRPGRLTTRPSRTTSHLIYSVPREVAVEWRELFGHFAWGKRVPPELANADADLAAAMLDGWLTGDGHSAEQDDCRPTVSGTTTSESLAYTMFHHALRTGKNPALSVLESGNPRKRRVYTIHLNSGQEVRNVDGEWFYRLQHRFRSAEITDVYDLEVEGEHTYNAGLMGVHNSIKGFDEFAYQSNFSFEPPLQALFLVQPEAGVTLRAPVHVLGDDERY